MPELDFRGLDEATRAAFKPHFADVVRRATRRRQRNRASAAAGVTALVLAASAAAIGVGGARRPDTAVVPSAPAHHVVPGGMVVGDVHRLYLEYSDCRGTDCTVMLATSVDGGTQWTRRPVPVPHNARLTLFYALAPRTLITMVTLPGPGQVQYWLASTDAGVTWHRQTQSTVDIVPPGWRALGSLGFMAADPATGRVANIPLSWGRPLDAFGVTRDLPPAAGLWITGNLSCRSGPTCTGSTVMVSRDGGRNWHRHTFAENLDAGQTSPGGPAVATLDGRTVYAVGAAAGEIVVYRTDDGGLTWHRTGAQLSVGIKRVFAGLDRYGRLLIQVGTSHQHPVTYLSADGGQSLRQASIGPGALASPVPGGYAYVTYPLQAWLSTDGISWSEVKPPQLG